MVAAGRQPHLFSCLEMFMAVSLQPLVREAGERDHVGPFVFVDQQLKQQLLGKTFFVSPLSQLSLA